MSSWRRSTRNLGKRPHPDSDDNQAPHEVAHGPGPHEGMGMPNMGMMGDVGMGMGMSNMGGHHSAEGYPSSNAFSYPAAHQQQYFPVDASQNVSAEELAPCSSRSLRARQNVATASNPATGGRGRKSGSSSTASASVANTSQPPANTREVESEGDEDDDGGTSGKSKNPFKMDTALTIDQMVQNVLYYLLLMQHKKVPAKRSDIIKTAMNSQHKQFTEVMRKLGNVLDEVFGMKLITIQSGKGKELPGGEQSAGSSEPTASTAKTSGPPAKKAKGPSVPPPTYILISKFPSSVFRSSMKVMDRADPETDSKATTLYLTLSTIFMLNRPIDEDVIWKVIKEMNLAKMVCKTKEELRKFLKTEFVVTGYLNMETTEQPNHPNARPHSSMEPTGSETGGINPNDVDSVKVKYSWGPRADKEFSKYAMLKFVTNRFPGRKMYEFTVQYNMVQKEEKEMMDKEQFGEGDGYDGDEPDGDNGSALRIKQRVGGKGQSYSIDGENTETETEGV